MVPEDVLDEVRCTIADRGASALAVEDLRAEDLPALGWSGSPRHLRSVREALERVPSGATEYLVVRAPSGHPIAKGGLDYADPLGPGKLWQLATHEALRGLGIGTHLIRALEDRARRRQLPAAWLGAETTNPRARKLYERLDYVAFDEITDGWESQRDDGSHYWHETRLTVMRHQL